jgi:hypothetical protein
MAPLVPDSQIQCAAATFVGSLLPNNVPKMLHVFTQVISTSKACEVHCESMKFA